MLIEDKVISGKRYCVICGVDISSKPSYHRYCSNCYFGIHYGGETIRTCDCCGKDISDRPKHHALCYDCWKETKYGSSYIEDISSNLDYETCNPRDFYFDEWGYYNVWGEFPEDW